ncbi:hypothetical protein [Aurantiacibacter spongiae]|uniref:Uncharacterized protein n=1 Tax=Aurantiacibacter spongiae TaxID=2488860 RepID=A0A3N5CY33_9SPHN|nr:hypothetical protein [Aurantiacibacter spongiae]RPF71549.1 hypothetical protein EG799_07900 [Aurantiacibacter spongiae]
MARRLDQTDDNGAPARPPLAAHPAFPFIVALWFAALLGIGSLVVPVALVEGGVSATGLPSVLPQAAPPLGFTARVLVALAATALGIVLGLVAARRIAASHHDTQARRIGARAPLSARDDLDPEGLEDGDGDTVDIAADDGPRLAGSRRRALAMEEDAGPSDFLYAAPLPGEYDDAAFVTDGEDEPLELEDLAAEPHLASADIRPGFDFGPPSADADAFEENAADEATAEAENPAEQEKRDEIEAPLAIAALPRPAEQPAPAPEPLAFSPPSMARREEAGDAPTPELPEEVVTVSEPDSEPFRPFDRSGSPPPHDEEAGSDRTEGAEHSEQGDEADMPEEARAPSGPALIHLVERLGATLERHREWSAQRVETPPPPVSEPAPPDDDEPQDGPVAGVPGDFDPAAADEAAQAMAAYFARSAAPQEPLPDETAPDEMAPDETMPDDSARDDSGSRAFDAPEAPSQTAGPARVLFGGATIVPDDEEDEEEDAELDEVAASFSLPLVRGPAAVPHRSEPDAGDRQAPAHEERAPFANPFRPTGETFVRIDEPDDPHETDGTEPAVQFPNQKVRSAGAGGSARLFDPPSGQAPDAAGERPRASNDDNERALREALMNLQRMGK